MELQAAGDSVLLAVIIEELFAIESEKLTGALSPEEYATIKAGLESVLKRKLARATHS
jgi:hypothetical protein